MRFSISPVVQLNVDQILSVINMLLQHEQSTHEEVHLQMDSGSVAVHHLVAVLFVQGA